MRVIFALTSVLLISGCSSFVFDLEDNRPDINKVRPKLVSQAKSIIGLTYTEYVEDGGLVYQKKNHNAPEGRLSLDNGNTYGYTPSVHDSAVWFQIFFNNANEVYRVKWDGSDQIWGHTYYGGKWPFDISAPKSDK